MRAVRAPADDELPRRAAQDVFKREPVTQSVSVLRGTASVPRYLLFAQRGRFLRVSATRHSLTPVTPAGARPSAHAALPLLAPGPTQSIAKGQRPVSAVRPAVEGAEADRAAACPGSRGSGGDRQLARAAPGLTRAVPWGWHSAPRVHLSSCDQGHGAF